MSVPPGSLLVMEQTDAGKYHCHIVLVAAGDHQIIPDGTAGLYDVLHAALVCSFHVVGEREERIGA